MSDTVPTFDPRDYSSWPYVVRYGEVATIKHAVRFTSHELAQAFADLHAGAAVTIEEKK